MGFWRAREVFAMMEVRWTRTLRSWFLLRVEQANLCPWHDKTIELWFQTRDKTENGPFGNELRVVKSIFDAEWYNQSVFTTVFSFCIVGTYVISMNETVHIGTIGTLKSKKCFKNNFVTWRPLLSFENTT